MIELKDFGGWVVTGHHDDVLAYVGPDEPQDQSQIAVGLFGRSKRHRDGTELNVVHVEDSGGQTRLSGAGVSTALHRWWSSEAITEVTSLLAPGDSRRRVRSGRPSRP